MRNYTYSENMQLAYYRNKAVYGEASPLGNAFRAGGSAAIAVVGAPLLAIGAVETGAAAALSQGAAYVARTSAWGLFRSQFVRSPFTKSTLITKALISLGGQTASNLTNRVPLTKIDAAGLISDALLPNGYGAIVSGFGAYNVDVATGSVEVERNSYGIGAAKFATGMGFGLTGDYISSSVTRLVGANGVASYSVDATLKLYSSLVDTVFFKDVSNINYKRN